MHSTARRRLEQIYARCTEAPLVGRKLGLEKECLRVAANGTLSRLAHPAELGSALTHPSITTDFSEALLEIVTPPFADTAQTLAFLDRTQSIVYSQLAEGELLWATSMPCGLKGDCDVPIGLYGSSNIARMKHVYRRGLGLRYGRSMQAIAGVHYNYSYPQSFWQLLAEVDDAGAADQDFISEQYFAMVRNILRYGWLIPYLFGASPAVCGTFFGERGAPERMSKMASNTYYEPYATCLRMGDIGYQNNRDEASHINADFNHLGGYVGFLQSAMTTESDRYNGMGLRDSNGAHQQLNTKLLQIENEYYSSVRPKQITEGMEMPSIALQRRGVQYIELRSLDVNAYDPLGINDEQLRFVESFLLFCMLADSPALTFADQSEFRDNTLAVAHRGRDPDLRLHRNGVEVSIRQWGGEILDVIGEMCDLLDRGEKPALYCNSLTRQLEKIHRPEVTPSATMLAEIQRNDEDFFTFGMRMSKQHQDHFAINPPSAAAVAEAREIASESHARQAQMESSDTIEFDQFLADYFGQLGA